MPAAAGANPAASANTLYDSFVEEMMQIAPEMATSLGLDTGAKAPLRAKLGKRSLSARKDGAALTQSMIARMKTIDRASLTGIDRVNYDAVLYGLEQEDALSKAVSYGSSTAPYTVYQLSGTYHDLPDFLDSQHPVETKADADAYLARLEAMARALDEECECIRHDAGQNVIPPDFALAGALVQMKTLRAPKPDASVMAASLARRTKEKAIAGDWSAKAAAIVADKVYPALDRQMALLESLQAKATHDAGVWKLPNGEAYYALCLASGTTTQMSPKEVHQIGLDVVAQCTAEADAIMKANGLTKGTVGQRLRAMFDDPKFRYPNTDDGKEKLLADLNAKLAEVNAKVPAYFKHLPKAGVVIKRIPKYIEAGAPGGYYQQPSLDGKRPGAYYINLRDTAEQPSWTLPTLTYHEAVPGHHFQISLAQETSLPLIRRIGGYNAYVEGWALYSEELAVEMGLYQNDPFGHIGQLHDAMLRGVRLVVDTGMHAMRWSREAAVSYYTATLGDPESGAISEIERYAVWPGQACGYMVGKRVFLAERARARAALGDRFDLKTFHDVVLRQGALPLDELKRIVDGYIAG